MNQKRHIFNIIALLLALSLLLVGCSKQYDTDSTGTVSSVSTQVADDTTSLVSEETTSSVEYTRAPVTSGYTAVLMGHSFFGPFYPELPIHAHNAGIVDHVQIPFFQGG